MEEIINIAKAHYNSGTQEVRALAHELFDSCDIDGDGKVDYNEFLYAMGEAGYLTLRNPNMFSELDIDKNETLDFWEVMALCYIILSGRPSCDACKKFIKQVYFTCVECYESPGETYHLCLPCYTNGGLDHTHEGRSLFLDSYTMLFKMRNLVVSTRLGNQNQPSPQMSNAIADAPQPNAIVVAPQPNANVVAPQPNAIVVAPQRSQSLSAQSSGTRAQGLGPRSSSSNANLLEERRSRMSMALRAFGDGLNIASIATDLCQIL